MYILEMNNISKHFPGVKALDNVNFKVKKGEIHCLVGENGAGKSTLMKVLSGVYPYGTYDGQIVLNGSEQKYNSISDSEKAGVAIIYQELALIPELPIYENLYYGHEIKSSNGISINWNETITQAAVLLKKVNVTANPSTKVKELGVGVQQLIEIAKALGKNVQLLILDEPTASLSETDSENLLKLIKELKKQGVSCIMISHKLKEVISIADTITVLRDGKTITSMDATKTKITENEIIKHMVGREIENVYPKRENKKFGDVAMELKNWSAIDNLKGRKILHDIDFNIRKGEIVGIAGIIGAGRTELALSVFGNPRKYTLSGDLIVDNKKISLNSPRMAINAGIAYVSEDRKGDGLVLIQDIKFNITLANLEALSKLGVINQNEEVIVAKKYHKDIKIKAPTIEQVLSTLSGGNQQKVSISKWLFAAPNILILDEPTRGIDVGAKFEIYTLMNELVAQGLSIIMISSELLEVIGMSDRIYVMADGKFTGELAASEATEEKIMAMATV